MNTSTSSSTTWFSRDFVAYHAGVQPAKTACIEFKTGEHLTYRDLDRRANRAAAAIQKLAGNVQGIPVALMARNSVEYVAFVIAAYRTGAVLQPLNWRLSATELEVVLSDAKPTLVVYEEEFSDAILEALKELPASKAITLATFQAEVANADPDPWTLSAVEPDSPFILLYTSGTTGKPKGAIITRRNAFFQSFNFSYFANVNTQSVLLCDSPLFHTVGLIAVTWTTLQLGATFAISDRFTPGDTLKRLLDEPLGATHYFGVPQIARSLVDDPAYQPRALSKLTAFVVGGAPMPQDLLERLLNDEVKVSLGLGMSEAGSVMHIPLNLEVMRAKAGSVGMPGPALQVRIVNEEGIDQPVDQVGEIWLRGPAVTPGYWKLPEASAASFSAGWFRTGDLARRDADGFHYILDRSKDMYISGGENVYPAEVESALLRIPGIADVAVIGLPDERWGEVGCAYIVCKPDVTFETSAIIEASAQWLASYKRPKVVRFIDAMPRNAAGKIVKAVLRKKEIPS